MARRKKKKLSDEETDQLIDQWISSIEDLREFFFEHAPEEEGDVFYDRFLEKFQIEAVLKEALEDYKAGKTKTISTIEELEADFEEMRKEANR